MRGKLARWALDLQQLSFDIVHRAGKAHYVPDAVSRLRRADEFDSNDEQGMDTDEVNDKAFEVAECKALPPVDVKIFFAKAAVMSDLDVREQPGFEPLFALEHCTTLKLVSVAMAQQCDSAVLTVNGLEF